MMIKIPKQRKWYRLLSQRYSPSIADMLIFSAVDYYQSFLRQNLRLNKRYYPFIETRVLPVLALYRAMQDIKFDQKIALQDLDQLLVDMYFKVQLQGTRLLNQILPNPFIVVKPFLRFMLRFSDLPEGQKVKQDTPDCFAMDVNQCFIFDTLKALNAPELTTVFCASDDRLSAEMTKKE